MTDVNNDEELLSLVRVTVGASSLNDLPTQDLRKELEESKADVSAEIQEILNRGGQLDFYNQDAPQKALMSLMFLRGKQMKESRGKGREKRPDTPRGISAIRRHQYDDVNERFWRDELVRNLNRIHRSD